MEAVRLRVKDIDFERHELTIRQGKGAKDRVTMLPISTVGQICDEWIVGIKTDKIQVGNMPAAGSRPAQFRALLNSGYGISIKAHRFGVRWIPLVQSSHHLHGQNDFIRRQVILLGNAIVSVGAVVAD